MFLMIGFNSLSRVILCLDIRESLSFYIHIYIFFAHCPIKYE